MNRRIRFYIFLWLVILSGGMAFAQPAVDLHDVDFNRPETYTISGDWQFFWNQLLTPDHFGIDRQPTTLMAVPGAWNRLSHFPALGYATYRVHVKIPLGTTGLGIYFPVINCAGRIWVNGQLLAETGVANSDRSSYQPKLSGTMVEVPAHSGELEVVVQVVNFSFFNGGFAGPPRIGKIAHLMMDLNRSNGMENFFAGSLIAMFIYQLILFSLFKNGKPYLWLALICLGVALRALIVHGGSFLLPTLFPSVPWEVWKKIEFTSVYAIAAFFPLYIENLFSGHAPRWPVRFFVALASVLCVTVLVTPQYIYGQLLDVGHVALLLTFLYAVYSVRMAWKNGNADARIIFFGVLLSFPFILTEMLKNSALFHPFRIHLMYLVEMGVLVFLLFQVYLLAHHYANAYKKLESLNENLEKNVAERTGLLTTANRVKDKLLSVVTHDIKSPLNSLRGILSIYNAGAIDALDFKRFSRRVEDDLIKTSLLVDNILYWTASQLKGTKVKFEEMDIHELVQENIALFQTIAAGKKLVIRNRLRESYYIEFDRNILNLTIRNLISNAIKFSFEGGQIVLQVKLADDALLISVTDSGTGISKDELKILRGSQMSGSVPGTNNEKGTGLGLSFCREYLEAAGAALTIDSTLGKGTIVTIALPKTCLLPEIQSSVDVI